MFFACGMWCLADVLSVSPSSEQTKTNLPVLKYKSFDQVYSCIKRTAKFWAEAVLKIFYPSFRANYGKIGIVRY